MKLNRKWIMVIALVLSLSMATAGTLAFLTDRDTVENTFTMGSVSIDLEETFTQDSAIKPGQTVNKDAWIVNDGQKDAWVWMTVSVPEGLKDYITPNWANGFQATAESPVVVDGMAVWTVLVNEPLEYGQKTENILDSVTLSPYVDYQGGEYVVVTTDDAGNVKTEKLADLTDNKLNVVVKAYAIQTDGIATVADAYDDYAGQWGEEVETIVGSGVTGGIKWTLTDAGKLTVSPSTETSVDTNSGKEFAPGQWRETVVYNEKGQGIAIGSTQPANEGGYFCDQNAVTSLVIEDGVTSIGSFAAKFPNLTGEVVIPASVTYIGQEAFQNTQITKLTFAAGGTEALCIAPGAFKNLQIEELVLPADRPSIHIHCWAFNDCTKLERVTFPANIDTFSSQTHLEYMGMGYSGSGDSQVLARCNALKSITFGSQEVHDLFFNAPYNTNNINAIGNVEIIVNE